MATGTLISDRSWHSNPSFNYSVIYETQRPNKYSATVKVRFTVVVRSLYTSCSFGYPIYFSNTIDNQFRTITSNFGNGIKSVSYTSDWIEFFNSGTSLSVGITPKCGDVGHTSYDTGTIYFDKKEEEFVGFNSHSVKATYLTSVEILYNSNKNLVAAESSLNGGNWKLLTIKSGNWNVGNNNVVYTISGLNPNTTYTIQTRIANVNGLWTYSNKLTFTTKDIARISNVNNFEHGNTVTALITNPAGISGLNLVMKIGGTQILSRTAKIGSNTISCTDAELDNL